MRNLLFVAVLAASASCAAAQGVNVDILNGLRQKAIEQRNQVRRDLDRRLQEIRAERAARELEEAAKNAAEIGAGGNLRQDSLIIDGGTGAPPVAAPSSSELD